MVSSGRSVFLSAIFGSSSTDQKLRDGDLPVGVQIVVVDEQAAVLREVRVECEPQEPLLTWSKGHRRREVKKWLGQDGAIRIHDPDRTSDFNDEHAATAIRWERDVDWSLKIASNLNELDLGVAGKVSTQQSRSGHRVRPLLTSS